ncbi:MAG: AAA family ATPase [Inquilinus sp.]|nr:AAA family ATPase [Inquilinus sp.]
MKLTLTEFRVLNYRNIDDSGWIPLEKVTAFVGRNESGKTALLKALHKFNPATGEPYIPQREFPRDRFTSDFRGDGGGIPVCECKFAISPDFREELRELLSGVAPPNIATCTKFYDGTLTIAYKPSISDEPVRPSELIPALDVFARTSRRLPVQDGGQEEAVQQLRTELANWAASKKDLIKDVADLKNEQGAQILRQIREEANGRARPETADAIETLVAKIEPLITRAETRPLTDRVDEAIEDALPVFIYFEDYGILDSAVYLPHLLEELSRDPQNSRVRTVNSMFKHVGLTAQEIAELGQEKTEEARRGQQQVTPAMIATDQASKELRAIKLSSASSEITKKFTKWYEQRRHNIRYDADGDFFRIWVSDDRRPGVPIELESRSKGFQWFFSFYLVFLVESQEGHKEAILLLDEPGLHLHPTAQQQLMSFFERLSEDNPLIYTTHSPFLIDGEHIHRVRPVKEDDTGHSQVSIDTWPEDRDTIFPLQAAAGYAMVRGLFRHKKNVLVEGFSDYLYLHTLNLHCRALGRTALPDDIYITPCGGTKLVGHLASLFLGQEVRPVVLLDGDDAGRARRDALTKELYAGHERAVLMLSEVLGKAECETEDIFGEAILLPILAELLGRRFTLNQDDRSQGSLVDQIKAAAVRHAVELPGGWKPEIARRVAVAWSTTAPEDIPSDILDCAEALFRALTERMERAAP